MATYPRTQFHSIEPATALTDAMNWSQLMRGTDIASAGTLVIPAVGEYFRVTGTTTINFITVDATMLDGRPFVLAFTGALTVTNHAGSPPGGTATILLAAGANFATVAGTGAIDGTKLVLRYDSVAVAFVEVGNVAAGAGGGTVTSVTATTPIASSGGTTPNITHVNSGVTAANYQSVTVDVVGHVVGGFNNDPIGLAFLALGYNATPGPMIGTGSTYGIRPYAATPNGFIVQWRVPINLQDMETYVDVDTWADAGTGGSYTVTLLKNGAATAYTATITATGMTLLTGGPVTFSAGDLYGWKIVGAGTVGVFTDFTLTARGIRS